MTAPADSHDVLDVLIREHREVAYLLNRLRLADEGSSRDVADRLIAHLVRHFVVEEMFVYPYLVGYLTDGEELLEHDLAEHGQIEGILRELDGLESTDQRFLGVVLDLQVGVAQHFAGQERSSSSRGYTWRPLQTSSCNCGTHSTDPSDSPRPLPTQTRPQAKCSCRGLGRRWG
jgi:hypothetical protein